MTVKISDWINIQLMLSQLIINGSFIIKQAEPMAQLKQEAGGIPLTAASYIDSHYMLWHCTFLLKFFKNQKTLFLWKYQTSETKRTKIRNPNLKIKYQFFLQKHSLQHKIQDLWPCIPLKLTNPQSLTISAWGMFRVILPPPRVRLSAHRYFLPIHMLKKVRLIWQLGPKDKTTITVLMGWTYVRGSTNGFLTCTCIYTPPTLQAWLLGCLCMRKWGPSWSELYCTLLKQPYSTVLVYRFTLKKRLEPEFHRDFGLDSFDQWALLSF